MTDIDITRALEDAVLADEGEAPPDLSAAELAVMADEAYEKAAIEIEREKILEFLHEAFKRVHAQVPPDQIYKWLQNTILAVGPALVRDTTVTWDETFPMYKEIIEKAREREAKPPHEREELEWPWPTWRKLLEPLEYGMLAVLAAGDGVGKSIYAENIAEYWAMMGKKVLFVHLELSTPLMLHRRASRHTGLEYRTLRRGAKGHDTALRQAEERLQEFSGSIEYYPAAGKTVSEIVAKTRQLKARGDCDVVIIDYLEKIASDRVQLRTYSSEFQREADTVEQLKIFSETEQVPVLLLSQFGKEGKKLPFESLTRTAIRGAGEKTEKANVVILLHREKDEDGNYVPEVNLRVDKNTVGATGSITQIMTADSFEVSELYYAEPEEDFELQGELM